MTEKGPAEKAKGIRRMSRDSSVNIRINPSHAIEDLHNRVNPKSARYHSTHFFFMDIVYALVAAFLSAMILFPVFSLLIGLFMGVFGWAISAGIASIGALAAFAAVILFQRSRYYASLKPKRATGPGISLGTAYQHYVNAFHYATGIGTQEKQEKPVMVGQTREFLLDYTAEPNPHMMILGGSGSGKTTTLRAFLVRAALGYGTRFLIIDWNGESEGWAGKINATLWKAGKHFRINPFLLRDASVAERAGSVAELFQFGAKLTPLQSNMLRTLAISHYQRSETPALMDIWRDVERISKDRTQTPEQRQYANWIDQRLRTVQRVFGTEPEEFWQGILKRNNVISLAGLNEAEKAIVAYSVFQRIVEYFNKAPELNRDVRLLVVLDDAWTILQNQKEEGQVYEPLPGRIARLGRKYGFGMIVSTQQLEDIPRSLINSSAIRIIHSYRDADFMDSAKRVFGLGDFESAYLGTAGIGEAFVFDQARAAKGQGFGDYVKVRPLDEAELKRISDGENAFLPQEIDEPELPIDMAVAQPGVFPSLPVPPPPDRPTPQMYVGLLTIYDNPGKPKADLVRLILQTGFVKNRQTVYGSAARPGVFDTLAELGLIILSGDRFAPTDKGLRWVDPARILDTDRARIGSTLHERMLIQTIRELQKKYMLVVVPEPKQENGKMMESVDLISYPIGGRKNYLWNDLGRRGYEIQTNAINRVILGHAESAERNGLPLTWVSYDPKILEAIKKLRGDKDEYMLVNI